MTRAPGQDSEGATGTVALIPLRSGGKSRLRDALTGDLREQLVLAMLDDVLTAVRGAGVDDIRVLSGDTATVEAAAVRGLIAIPDPELGSGRGDGRVAPGDRSLRAAVDTALAAVGDGCTRLIVAADLPRLTPDEVRAACEHPADVVIAATAGGGTALLRLAPDVTLPSRYGPGSALAHASEADRLQRTSAVLDLPGARHDVDAAADLSALRRDLDGTRPGAATSAFLAGLRG